MHLGIALPFGDIGGDGPIVREYAELAEAEGYDGLTLADHVLGGNPANPDSGRAGGLGLFHDPFVAFGFIAACTKKVELSTQVLILAQRQTFVAFGFGERSELAHDRPIAADVPKRQGNSEMHGRSLAVAGCRFPASL